MELQGSPTYGNIYVSLFNEQNVCVGHGYVGNLKPGEILHTHILLEDEVAIFVTNVLQGFHIVDEPFVHLLLECDYKFIRWKKHYVQLEHHNGIDPSRRNHFAVFEWTEEGGCTSPHVQGVFSPKNTSTSSLQMEHTQEDLNKNNHIVFTSTQSNSAHAYTYGEEPQMTRRKYIKKIWGPSKKSNVRKIGEDRLEKVNLAKLKSEMKSTCANHCWAMIHEMDILEFRHHVWVNNKDHDSRVSWILTHMHACKQPLSASGWLNFEFRIYGIHVCHACYAHVLGYSPRQVERWKKDIRTMDRKSACHGNALKPHETTHVVTTRALFQRYVKGCGCVQPHRQHLNKKEGNFVPLILLPMNTKKKDIRALINDYLLKDGEKEISVSAFHAMWREFFSHVQIPTTSRFAKCNVCWEFTSTLEKVVSNKMKDRLKRDYQQHHKLQRQERDAYEEVKLDAKNRPDKYLSIIVDGMDQNTTMVPKMWQCVKNIEGRYVKTHLCGVLVHGWGLCCDLWIDAHHKHDNNQVVTSIMRVLNHVHSSRGVLPPILCIQADNCARENKNKYLLGLCATLVGLSYFEEVRVGFLLVGHTHSDIDQRFSCISHILKGDDINTLSELLRLIHNHIPGHPGEPIRYAELMENIWDWKDFITPHFYSSRSTEFTGVSEPHHFRFYVQNSQPHVQHKIYANDTWEPADGEPFLRTIPDIRSKPGFAEVFHSDNEEMAALQSFIGMKERQLERHTCLNALEEQLQSYQNVIVETKAFVEYLKDFPTRDRTVVHSLLPFWWTIPLVHERLQNETQDNKDLEEVLSCFLAVEHRGYFGPRGKAPRPRTMQSKVIKEQQKTPQHGIIMAISFEHGHSSCELVSNAVPMQRSRWFDFDPHMDVHIGDFVGVQAPPAAHANGEVFWIAKVREVRNLARKDGEFLALWYLPTMPRGVQDGPDAMRSRYTNCLARTWEPNRTYKGHDWISVATVFISWLQGAKLKPEMVTVQGFRTEKKISIPIDQHAHFKNHLLLLGDTGSDDDHVD